MAVKAPGAGSPQGCRPGGARKAVVRTLGGRQALGLVWEKYCCDSRGSYPASAQPVSPDLRIKLLYCALWELPLPKGYMSLDMGRE